MTVAVIRDGKVVNIITCESVELARELLPDAVCVDGDGLAIRDEYPPGPKYDATEIDCDPVK